MYKIDKLLKADRRLWHTQDLAVLWGVTNRNTLYTAIKRYVAKGILFPIHKGLYSTLPTSDLDPVEVGLAIWHRYAYVSCETILARCGLISQAVYPVTLVSSQPGKFAVSQHQFLVRQMTAKYLFQTAGIGPKGYVFEADCDRAVADMLYFDPQYHFDNSSQIDWDRVKQIQQKVGYP